ncbi:D-glycero-beta-D-manno-heptose-7-phosphate kinase [Inquilinus sp. KBS0705]|nr:D-glycero-beta-D-manno-heptose-7-phosphate kinase [Inquilinus sp. KBS0705]
MRTEILGHLKELNKQPSVLVIGDLMLDHYLIGKATRLSPEAPVPVVRLKNEHYTLGGAGNVAQNLIALGAVVSIGSVVGNDSSGYQLRNMLNDAGVNTDNIVIDNARNTTVKTRIMADSYQIARVDSETTNALSTDKEHELIDTLINDIEAADIVVLSDYNKGLLSLPVTRRVIELANLAGKAVIIDPKGTNYKKYRGAFIIKPNRHELALATKMDQLETIDEVLVAARVVLEQTDATYLVVTLSEEGMIIVDNTSYVLLPVKATEVFDVTGAGDTVLATIAYFLASGFDLTEACELANHAAAIVIRQVGSVTTTLDEIAADIIDDQQRLTLK